MQTFPIKADRLRELRESLNLTQLDVEQKTGLPSGRLTLYETGRQRPNLVHLVALADFFNVKPKSLLTEETVDEVIKTATTLANLVGSRLS